MNMCDAESAHAKPRIRSPPLTQTAEIKTLLKSFTRRHEDADDTGSMYSWFSQFDSVAVCDTFP
jgi:hypothetical protein